MIFLFSKEIVSFLWLIYDLLKNEIVINKILCILSGKLTRMSKMQKWGIIAVQLCSAIFHIPKKKNAIFDIFQPFSLTEKPSKFTKNWKIPKKSQNSINYKFIASIIWRGT